MLKYKYIFEIKHTEAIFVKQQGWFEIAKMLIAA